jgi:uncharacterized repeat protein (TIGR03803 family)
VRTIAQSALTVSVAAALIAGCGGSQPSISAPGAMPQNDAMAASSYKVLHSFGGSPDGFYPAASLINVKGTLYGTTRGGGDDRNGTVFTVTMGGAEKVLYSFMDFPDGKAPGASLVYAGGTLYGTTENGGSRLFGTIFSIAPNGVEKVLHSFSGKPDARRPHAAMIDVGGTLYGTSYEGGDANGQAGDGTVFSVTKDGTEKVLHSFGHGTDGRSPVAPLIDVGGILYGTTVRGGQYGAGTIFSITTSGAEKVLYSFRGAPDGADPAAGLVDIRGTLYGTTISGGKYNGNSKVGCGDNCGTVYSISTTGTEKVLHSFGNGVDGIDPIGALTNVKSTLYGTTEYGGAGKCGLGCGTVFGISTSGTEKVVHNFGPSADGFYPFASLIYVKSALYGTTYEGGSHGRGTVFALTY